MKPDHFRDIIATNALYRPGPLEGGMVDDYIQVKHRRKEAEYKHPVMKDILEETHGVMVYQEQVMRILNRLGGIELSSAYSCIKAISKKKLPMIAKFREQFIKGAVEQGLKAREAEELFGMIEKFAGYGFNKSHSTAYALIAYMTAYLKAHYSVEFMAALLSGDIQGRNFKKKDSLVEHLEDCRRMNITVVSPDVNRCNGDFAVEDGQILFGLAAVKGCGMQAAEAIRAERKTGGPFRNLFDFCERLDPAQVNRGAIESLVKAGAFDFTGARRSQNMAAIERALQSGASALADRRSGQKGLFEDAAEESSTATGTLPDLPEWPERERLSAEKEVLGFYLSSHPLAEHEETLRSYCTHNTVEATALPHRTDAVLGGILASIKFAQTKNPRPGSTATKYAMFDLEDTAGMMRCIVWPEEFANYSELIKADGIVALRGVIDKRPGSEEANFIVNEVITLPDLATRFTRGVMIRVDEQPHGVRGLEQLYEILRGYPGNCELQLALRLADGSQVTCACDGLRVELNGEMRSRVEDLLGQGSLRPVASRPKPTNNGNNGNGQRGYSRQPAGARS
jgi:DNA polymerase-3 subunit alpha